MSDTLGDMRKRFNTMIEEAADALDLERQQHEQQLVSAMESLSQDAAVRCSYADGRSDERRRCLAMIDDHLRTLNRDGINALALKALRSAVEDA